MPKPTFITTSLCKHLHIIKGLFKFTITISLLRESIYSNTPGRGILFPLHPHIKYVIIFRQRNVKKYHLYR